MGHGVPTSGARFRAERRVLVDGLLLEDLKEFQDDPHIVNLAVNNNGLALQFASERLQQDPFILHSALSQNGAILELAPDHIKADIDMVILAIESNALAMKHADPKLLQNKDFILKMLSLNIRGWDMLPLNQKRDGLVLLTVHKILFPEKCILDINLADFDYDFKEDFEDRNLDVDAEFCRKFKAYFEQKIKKTPDFAMQALGYGIPINLNDYMEEDTNDESDF